MRFLPAILVLGGALVTAAACGTTSGPTAASPTTAAATSVSPTASGKSTKEICDAIDPDRNPKLDAFAKQYGVMIGLRIAKAPAAEIESAKTKAQAALKEAAADLRRSAEGATDAQFRAHLEESATKMEASAAKAAFFDTPKTEAEIEKVLTTEMIGWLTPVMADCA